MTAVAGTVVQIAAPSFHVDVTVRREDIMKYRHRQDAYKFIAKPLRALRRIGLQISEDELFANAICNELANIDGQRTRKELIDRIPGLRSVMMRDLPEDGGPLVLTGKPGKWIVDYLGAGVGLALVDRLLSIDTSYFRRIPETSKFKTLDFESSLRASTGEFYVQVEVKGRTGLKNVSEAWEGIDAKKFDFREGKGTQRDANAPLPPGTPTYLIGTVTSIPLGGIEPTLVTIGDPAIPAFDGDPARAKLLQRLWFYQRALSAFQPRGALLAALSERVGNLTRPEIEWRKFDEQRLFNSQMEEWELGENIAQTVRIRSNDQIHGRSVFTKKRARRANIEMETPSITKEPFFFIGLHRNVLLALVRQDFEEIADKRYERRHIRSYLNDGSRLMYQHPSGLIVSAVSDVRKIDEGSLRELF